MEDHLPSPLGTTLVIGYGNTLRRDDGVGPRIASTVAGWALPGVDAIAVPQLTPELAEPVAAARLVLFIDARHPAEGEGATYHVEPVRAEARGTALGHISDPRGLLALAVAIYGRHPEAWTITVPASDLSLGEGLSPHTSRAMEAAVRHLALVLAAEGRPIDIALPLMR